MLGLPALASPARIAWVSDIHLDLMYGTPLAVGPCRTNESNPYGSAACDTPLLALQSLMDDVVSSNFSYMFVAGDLICHDIVNLGNYSFAINTFATVFRYFSEFKGDGRFTAPSVAFALGNNDRLPAWELNVSQSYDRQLHNLTEILLDDDLLAPSDALNFSHCAFYSHAVSASLRVIVLNTIIYAPKLKPPVNETLVPDPCAQFDFLSRVLQLARQEGRRVVIIAHVPPVMGIEYINSPSGLSASTEYWKPQYQRTYFSVVAEFKDVVALQLFGHMHMFAMFADEALGMPIMLIPGVTQIDNNSASYLSVDMDDTTWGLTSLTQRTINDTTGVWSSGLSLNDLMAGAGISVAPGADLGNVTLLAAVIRAMFTNDTLWNTYVKMYSGGAGNTLPLECATAGSPCRTWVLCSMLHVYYDDIVECEERHSFLHQNNARRFMVQVIIGVSVTVGVVLVVVAIIAWVRGKRKGSVSLLSSEAAELESCAKIDGAYAL